MIKTYKKFINEEVIENDNPQMEALLRKQERIKDRLEREEDDNKIHELKKDFRENQNKIEEIKLDTKDDKKKDEEKK